MERRIESCNRCFLLLFTFVSFLPAPPPPVSPPAFPPASLNSQPFSDLHRCGAGSSMCSRHKKIKPISSIALPHPCMHARIRLELAVTTGPLSQIMYHPLTHATLVRTYVRTNGVADSSICSQYFLFFLHIFLFLFSAFCCWLLLLIVFVSN